VARNISTLIANDITKSIFSDIAASMKSAKPMVHEKPASHAEVLELVAPEKVVHADS